jgi:hypothetical protein
MQKMIDLLFFIDKKRFNIDMCINGKFLMDGLLIF